MDRWSGKRAIEARPKGVGIVLRDRFNNKGPDDKKKPMKFTRFVASSDKKEKSLYKPLPKNGKEVVIGTSSSSSSREEKQPLSSQVTVKSDELETVENEGRVYNNGKIKVLEAESSNSSRIKKGFRQRFGLSNKQEFRPSPLLSGLSRKVDNNNTINKRKVYGESSSSVKGKNVNVTEPSIEERQYRGFNLRGVNRSISSSYGVRLSNRGRNGLPSINTRDVSQNEVSNNLESPVSLELFSGSLSRQDSFRSYNLDGISEILPELDRIEQDIELNYEELLMMETGLLLGGLSFYDQHREMRLDIDNMSYEELLALEERIGTVSTALTEEAISKCLKTSVYKMKPYGFMTKSACDAKCSICQEEYNVGDEVGRLNCEHMYHVKCVKDWLRMKSWCPICKANAESSSASSK